MAHYFGVGLPAGSVPPYTGGLFDSLEGGGDRHDVRDRITAADLLAVRALSVRPPVRTELNLLLSTAGQQLTELLADIPADVDLVDGQGLTAVLPGSSAQQAHRFLKKDQTGIGWVTAGKILARKRPRLIPVWDPVLRCALYNPTRPWAALHFALAHHHAQLHTDLLHLQVQLDLPHVAPLRLLDVTLWTAHYRQHRTHGCRGLLRP